MRNIRWVVAMLIVGGGLVAAQQPAAAAGCDTVSTTPVFAGKVPTAKQVLGFDLGSRQATGDQLNQYLAAVDKASDQLVTGTFATTATGRPLKYALVSRKKNLSPAALRQLSLDAALLRRPDLPAAVAKIIQARMPVILWLTANVHGNEAAGGDAVDRIAYELTDRTDCVASRILDNAVVGLIPSQNPDGRAANTRQNAYAFDMNRDWFARTQPETDGKLDLLAKYPPQLFIDEHGMGGDGYFFPPNTDPTYHETSDASVHWINNVYGAANAAAFTAKKFAFETYESGYDLFYQGYGDSVPTTQFGAAGMTFEVGQQAAFPLQTEKHYTSGMASLFAGASQRKAIVTGWHDGYVQAQKQGQQCVLQPNKVYNPGHTVQLPVPDIKVCGYFLRTDNQAKKRDTAIVVKRLQQAGVRVYRLPKPLYVKDFTAYGRTPAAATMPAGTYWIPMNQQEKHWIQAMLNENTYVPFPYFYDVSGWSMALLSNLDGGYSGQLVKGALPVSPVTVPKLRLPSGLPRIGILSYSSSPFRPAESAGWLRWRLDKDWKIPSVVLSPSQVSPSVLANLDALLVPEIDATTAKSLLGAAGKKALVDWTNAGGHYVGWEGGAQLAAGLGLSTAVLRDPTGTAPGTLFRVRAPNSPLTAGVGATDWVMYNGDPVMTAANPASVVASYPPVNSPDWFVSGYQEGAEELGGTAAEISEPVGTGRVTVFAIDPNFRAFSDGSAKLLFNAITAARGTVTPGVRAPQRLAAEQRAAQAAGQLSRAPDAVLAIRVRPADAAATGQVLGRHGVAYRTVAGTGSVLLVVDGGRAAAADPEPWVRALPAELRAAGVRPLAIQAT